MFKGTREEYFELLERQEKTKVVHEKYNWTDDNGQEYICEHADYELEVGDHKIKAITKVHKPILPVDEYLRRRGEAIKALADLGRADRTFERDMKIKKQQQQTQFQ